MSRQQAIAMLTDGQAPERYQRNIGTVGIAGQICLLNAKAVVVGAGGLGGHVVELLARQGIGYLRIIDGDNFALHNLNRQLLATEDNIGFSKARAAAARVREINSDIEISAVADMLDEQNADELLADMDVVIDALDSIRTRLIVCKTAQRLGIPLVHGAIAGFTGQITTILPGSPGLEKIYKLSAGADKGVETALGNPAATPAFAAAMQVQEVVKLLTGVGELLDRRLFYFDMELNHYEILQL